MARRSSAGGIRILSLDGVATNLPPLVWTQTKVKYHAQAKKADSPQPTRVRHSGRREGLQRVDVGGSLVRRATADDAGLQTLGSQYRWSWANAQAELYRLGRSVSGK